MSEHWIYVLFEGDNYYPSGGMGDYVATFKTVADAKASAGPCQWAEIAKWTGSGLTEVTTGEWKRGKGWAWDDGVDT